MSERRARLTTGEENQRNIQINYYCQCQQASSLRFSCRDGAGSGGGGGGEAIVVVVPLSENEEKKG